MKIEKLGEYKVRCRMSAEEMTEYDIRTEDFTGRSEKLHEFIGHILDRVRDELGMDMDEGMLSAQIVGAAGKDITIILTNEVGRVHGDLGQMLQDACDNIEQGLGEQFGLPEDLIVPETIKKAFKDMATSKGAKSKNAMKSESEVVPMPFITPGREGTEEKTEIAKKEVKKEEIGFAVYSFANFAKAEAFIATLGDSHVVRLSLYKDANGCVQMVIRKCKESQNKFAGICASALEFGSFVSHDKFKLSYLKEHCTVIFDNKKIDFIKEFI